MFILTGRQHNTAPVSITQPFQQNLAAPPRQADSAGLIHTYVSTLCAPAPPYFLPGESFHASPGSVSPPPVKRMEYRRRKTKILKHMRKRDSLRAPAQRIEFSGSRHTKT